jgi:hypothetical protein
MRFDGARTFSARGAAHALAFAVAVVAKLNTKCQDHRNVGVICKNDARTE